MNDWYERESNWWMLVDEDNFVLGQIRHFPNGWRLQWRAARPDFFQEKWWEDTELEEAKAWGLAMIRMHQ